MQGRQPARQEQLGWGVSCSGTPRNSSRRRRGIELATIQQTRSTSCATPTPQNVSEARLTSVVLALDVRLLAVTLADLAVALGLVGPDHEAGVPPARCHQQAVVVRPAHVGDVRAVGHVALELCVLPLGERREETVLGDIDTAW